MAVFVCGLDESSGSHQRDVFYMGGFVAPATEWSVGFNPAWKKRVLAGPPEIPYLHMTDIRNREWCEEHGVSKADANERVDAAIDLVEASILFPIVIKVDGGEVRDYLAGLRIAHPNGGSVPLNDPDYISFFGYCYILLSHVAQTCPSAERVNFIIERNGEITKYIQAFHSGLAASLAALERSDLAKLVGDLMPAGKECVPLQAADMLCWHTARSTKMMNAIDINRYAKLARKTGILAELDGNLLKELATVLSAFGNDPASSTRAHSPGHPTVGQR